MRRANCALHLRWQLWRARHRQRRVGQRWGRRHKGKCALPQLPSVHDLCDAVLKRATEGKTQHQNALHCWRTREACESPACHLPQDMLGVLLLCVGQVHGPALKRPIPWTLEAGPAPQVRSSKLPDEGRVAPAPGWRDCRRTCRNSCGRRPTQTSPNSRMATRYCSPATPENPMPPARGEVCSCSAGASLAVVPGDMAGAADANAAHVHPPAGSRRSIGHS